MANEHALRGVRARAAGARAGSPARPMNGISVHATYWPPLHRSRGTSPPGIPQFPIIYFPQSRTLTVRWFWPSRQVSPLRTRYPMVPIDSGAGPWSSLSSPSLLVSRPCLAGASSPGAGPSKRRASHNGLGLPTFPVYAALLLELYVRRRVPAALPQLLAPGRLALLLYSFCPASSPAGRSTINKS